MLKAIVTGGAGFIGSYIVENLLERGFQVIVLDNLSPGSINNLKLLPINKSLEFIEGSVGDLPLLQKLFEGIDFVFHQATIPKISTNDLSIISYLQDNSNGILNVLQSAKNNKVKKVIYASSSAVYGNEPTLPKCENMNPDPQNPYALAKLIAENYCLFFNKFHSLPCVCLRYFNVYGPRQNPNSPLASVIPKFIQRVLSGKPPVIFGDGEQSRDFVFVRDIASANILAAESDATGIYNIGTGQRISLNQLAQGILKLLNREDIKTIYEKEIPGEIKHSFADISKAKYLGYTPKYSFEAGLKETIEKFQK